jgi:hypothetical protein
MPTEDPAITAAKRSKLDVLARDATEREEEIRGGGANAAFRSAERVDREGGRAGRRSSGDGTRTR